MAPEKRGMAHQCMRVVERVNDAKENGGRLGELISVEHFLICPLWAL